MSNLVLAGFLLSSALLIPFLVSSSPVVQDSYSVVQDANRGAMNGGTSAKLKVGGDRRQLGKKKSGGGNNNDNYLNPIDRCLDYPGWESNRQAMANCPVGFGKDAVGGRDGKIYVVTTESDDNPDKPKFGTLRYGVIMNEPKWITFKRDTVIRLKKDLVITQPFLTIDGRGADVKITGGPCLSVHRTTNV